MENFLLISSLVLSFIAVVAVAVLFVNLARFEEQSEGHLRSDRRLKTKIAQKIDKEAEGKLDQILSAVSKTISQSVEQELAQIDEATSRQIQSLGQYILAEKESITNQSQLLVASLVSGVEKELDAYKKSQIGKTDQQVYAIIVRVAKEVLGKTMNASEHEELVEKALEKAKRDKFFR